MVHVIVQLARPLHCEPPHSLSLCLTDPIRNVTSLSNPACLPAWPCQPDGVLLPANGATAFLRRSRTRDAAAHGAAAAADRWDGEEGEVGLLPP